MKTGLVVTEADSVTYLIQGKLSRKAINILQQATETRYLLGKVRGMASPRRDVGIARSKVSWKKKRKTDWVGEYMVLKDGVTFPDEALSYRS